MAEISITFFPKSNAGFYWAQTREMCQIILARFASAPGFVVEGVEICQYDLSRFRNRIVNY